MSVSSLERTALSERLGTNFTPLCDATCELLVDGVGLTVFVGSDYPDEAPPEVFISTTTGCTAFTQKDLDNAVIHLWEGSDRSPVLLDVVEWVHGRVAPDTSETKKDDDDDDDGATTKPSPDRPLVIYTWGDQMRKSPPSESQKNFNAKCLNCRGGGIDLKTMNGTWPVLQAKVKTSSSFTLFRRGFISAVEKGDLTTVSVNCSKGRHRCASFAEVMREDYPLLVVHHLSLKTTTTPTSRTLCLRNKKSRK